VQHFGCGIPRPHHRPRERDAAQVELVQECFLGFVPRAHFLLRILDRGSPQRLGHDADDAQQRVEAALSSAARSTAAPAVASCPQRRDMADASFGEGLADQTSWCASRAIFKARTGIGRLARGALAGPMTISSAALFVRDPHAASGSATSATRMSAT